MFRRQSPLHVTHSRETSPHTQKGAKTTSNSQNNYLQVTAEHENSLFFMASFFIFHREVNPCLLRWNH
jgi:hypothetical protein